MELKKQVIVILLLCGFLTFGQKLLAQVPSFREMSQESGITDVADITDVFGNGAAAADFDQDGDIDFYLTTDEDIADRLYRNDGQGQFTDVALELGIAEMGSNRTALWFDFNGDHRLDLVVAGENCVSLSCTDPIRLALYRQEADGHFTEVAAQLNLVPGPAFDLIPFYGVGGLTAADLNNDDYLDLLLTVWGGGIMLFQNNAGSSFSEVSTEVGLVMEKKTPWQAMVHDFNDDGWLDIYCNVDFAGNKLWINQQGQFEDQAEAYGVATAFNEMGMCMSDYDNDGDLDIYMTNITRDFQGQPQYNVLYERQNGQARFREVALSEGVGQSGWDWGTTFLDINNDGRQDLITTNGWDSLFWEPDPTKVWMNTNAGFVDVSAQSGLNDMLKATSLLAFDIDRDGDQDLLQTLKDNPGTQKPLHLYGNQLELLDKPDNFLVVQLRMPGANHLAIGSKVSVLADQLRSARLISAGCSFYGQEPAEAFFGLGSRQQVTEVMVRWPKGEVSIYDDLEINTVETLIYEVVQPPMQLEATVMDEGIELRWQDDSDDETGFVIHRSTDSTFAQYDMIFLPENITTYMDIEKLSERNYYYRIRSHNEQVYSDNSNIAHVQIEQDAEVMNPEWVVAPNPIEGTELQLKTSSDYEGMVRLALYQVSGQQVWSLSLDKTADQQILKCTIPRLQGIYMLQTQTGTKKSWHKLAFTGL